MADKTGIEWCDATWNPSLGEPGHPLYLAAKTKPFPIMVERAA